MSLSLATGFSQHHPLSQQREGEREASGGEEGTGEKGGQEKEAGGGGEGSKGKAGVVAARTGNEQPRNTTTTSPHTSTNEGIIIHVHVYTYMTLYVHLHVIIYTYIIGELSKPTSV